MATVDFEPQPCPAGGEENVTPRLIEYLQQRAEIGLSKYGHPLQTQNGRDALRDALDEAIDLCQYLMQAIMERDSRMGGDGAP